MKILIQFLCIPLIAAAVIFALIVIWADKLTFSGRNKKPENPALL